MVKPITDEELTKINNGLKTVSKGPWEVEWIKSEGSYGSGPHCREGFETFQLLNADGESIGDALNSDVAMIEEESSGDCDDVFLAFDAQGKADFEHIARLDPDTVASMIARIRADAAEIEKLKGPKERIRNAPAQGYEGGIPWKMHLRAYDAYCSKWSPQQALIEGGCRGGFGVNELDEFIPGWREELSLLAKKDTEIDRLGKLVFVPGRRDCAKCGFSQMSINLHVNHGQVSANDKPIDCPNGCGPCWPVTERDAGNEAHERITEELDRADLYKSQITELKAVLKLHHEWHQQPNLEIKLGDEFFDCASCYVDSTFEERTTAALKGEE